MPHGGLGTLAPSQVPGAGAHAWVELGSVADASVRRVWLRTFDNIVTTAAGLSSVTIRKGSTQGGLDGGCGFAGKQFTRASDSVVMTVSADDIIAVATA